MAKSASLTIQSILVAIALPTVLMTAFALSPLADDIEERVPLQINFSLRHSLGLEPAIDPKIHILAYDDEAVRAFKTSAPKLLGWREILKRLDTYHPRVAMIDKLFDLPERNADFVGFVEAMHQLSYPVVIGAFSSPAEIMGRKQLATKAPWGDLAKFIPEGQSIEAFNVQYSWLAEKPHFPYGAPTELVDAFGAIGHITYHGYFLPPILRFPEGRILPHWSFFATGGPKLKDGRLVINDFPVPLDRKGRITVNFLHEGSFEKVIHSMGAMVSDQALLEHPLPIKPDDVVLILPGMFTGHADWVQSPMGEIPGGLLLASLVNSGLQKNWMTMTSGRPFYVAAASILGGLLALLPFSPLAFWAILAGIIAGIFGAGFGLFVFLSIVAPWFSLVLAFFVSASAVHAMRSRQDEKEHFRLKQEFATARIVQDQLFPPMNTQINHLKVVGQYEPAAECGGDFWNHFELKDGRQFIIIGDAVGHGIPAALVAVSAQATAACLAEVFGNEGTVQNLSPAYVLRHLNEVLVTSFKSEITMTACVAEFSLSSGKVRFANAGHCLPFAYRFNKTGPVGSLSESEETGIQLLRGRGDPLGIDLQTKFKDMEMNIPVGCRIHFYTDGLIECRDRKGQILGTKRFMEFFRRALTQDALKAIAGVYELVKTYSNSQTLEDDGTIIIVETI